MSGSEGNKPVSEQTAFLESPRAFSGPEVETAGRCMLACLERAAGDETPVGAIYSRYLRS